MKKDCTIKYENDFINIYWDDELVITNNKERTDVGNLPSYFQMGIDQRIEDGDQLPKKVEVERRKNEYTHFGSGKYWEDEPYTLKSNPLLGEYIFTVKMPLGFIKKEKDNGLKMKC